MTDVGIKFADLPESMRFKILDAITYKQANDVFIEYDDSFHVPIQDRDYLIEESQHWTED